MRIGIIGTGNIMSHRISRRTFLSTTGLTAISPSCLHHFPFPGTGHIRPLNGGGFEWQPVQWQFEA